MIKAVIFDMDGLMIDSEPFHYQSFRKVLNHYGKELTEEEFNKQYVGISDIDATRAMVARFNIPTSPEALCERKQEEYKSFLQTQVIPQPGLITLLEKLHASGIKTAIASSSTLSEIQTVIDTLNINTLINIYCSAEQVKNGKPSPDIFLLASDKLGTEPSNCLVLEDAPSGIDAAIAAGMTCYVIPSRETNNRDFSKANKVLNSLEDVPYYLLIDFNINLIGT